MTDPSQSSMDYARWRDLLADQRLPMAVVDLDAVDHNLTALMTAMDGHPASLRVASKSVRCPWLLRYLLHQGAPLLRGLMTWSVRETELLASLGFDDLLLAYPIGRRSDADALVALTAQGRRVMAVADSVDHVTLLSAAAQAHEVVQPTLLDLDLSWRPGPGLHLGVRRSPLRTPQDAVVLAQQIQDAPGLLFGGVLAYEAQIAGVPDHSRARRALDPARRAFKNRSVTHIRDRRQALLTALDQAGIPASVVNGGGTGSVLSTVRDPSVNEVTVGSGFLCPHLFDGYDGLDLIPAAFFAIEVARRSDPDHLTCAQGGWIASGPPAPDRAPIVHLPPGLSPLRLEGWGETQTPFRDRDQTLAIGDPVICRHAKAGELFEHFGQVALVRQGRIQQQVHTYRGLGL